MSTYWGYIATPKPAATPLRKLEGMTHNLEWASVLTLARYIRSKPLKEPEKNPLILVDHRLPIDLSQRS
jgi:hypothetical protein